MTEISHSMLSPDRFPMMRSTQVDPTRFDEALEDLAEGLVNESIRNPALLRAKEHLNRVIDDTWKKYVAAPFFWGRGDLIPEDLQDLYWSFMVTNMHEVIIANRAVSQTTVEHQAVDMMRAVIAEALPLAQALAWLKRHVVKGRAPSTGPAKPVNPNKIVRTCPVCFRQIAVVSATMALHGYTRPGQGFQTASCPGIRFEPLEVSSKGLEWLIGALRKNLAVDELAYANRATQPEFLMGKRNVKAPREQIRRGDPLWDGLFKKYLAKLHVSIAMNREGIPPLVERLANWKPASPD